jgi:plastocyanin
MRRAIVISVCAALVAAGCGSSTTAPPTGTGTPATTAAGTTSTPAGSHLSLTGTPKFASPSPSAPVLSGRVPIAYRYFTIDPDVVRVKAGSTIVWTNGDPGPDNVTSVGGPQPFASKLLAEGATFSVRLTRPGVIHYESTLHPATLNGTIEVLR